MTLSFSECKFWTTFSALVQIPPHIDALSSCRQPVGLFGLRQFLTKSRSVSPDIFWSLVAQCGHSAEYMCRPFLATQSTIFSIAGNTAAWHPRHWNWPASSVLFASRRLRMWNSWTTAPRNRWGLCASEGRKPFLTQFDTVFAVTVYSNINSSTE